MEKDYFSDIPAPQIRRARGYLLYTSSGLRFLDFYQDNGRALLGHRPEGMQRVIKSTVSKGLMASYPSVYSGRVEKMMKKIFPESCSIRMYRNRERMLGALASGVGEKKKGVEIKDPLFDQTGEIMLWRPFLSARRGKTPLIIPLLPFPGDCSPKVVVNFDKNIKLCTSDTSSAFITDTLVNVISNLVKVLSSHQDQDLSVFDAPFLERRDRYLIFKMKEDEYNDLYRKSLEAGIFLPPAVSLPGIIPLEYEEGQVKKFIALLKEMG